jgi:hypothetical protein
MQSQSERCQQEHSEHDLCLEWQRFQPLQEAIPQAI